jgi:F-type H+-transporting ATPase subunit delta
MTNQSAAIRYARALFDVALSEKADLVAIESQLDDFNVLVDSHEVLRKALLNPSVPVPRKRGAVAQLVDRVGMTPILGRLVVLLAGRDRLVILPQLLAAFRTRLREYQEVVSAEIISAEPLAPERALAIERSLQKATKRSVLLSTRVDPGIIGGLVAHVGGTVYDASLAMQLEKMRKRLAESV